MAIDHRQSIDTQTGKRISVPDACAAPDGKLLFSWERKPHYLELEIIQDSPAEFFYQHSDTGEMWDYDYHIGNILPETALEKLRLFS